jgi:hypothetical protein
LQKLYMFSLHLGFEIVPINRAMHLKLKFRKSLWVLSLM